MPSENNYQKVFFEYTRTLDQRLLGQICRDHDIEVAEFLAWVGACSIRKAKVEEVTQSRTAEMERNKK